MNDYTQLSKKLETVGKTADDRDLFEAVSRLEIEAQGNDEKLKALSLQWFNHAAKHKYSYHFKWMGIPIIQHPTDMIITQELVFSVKPDLIIECGVARGGSLVYYASLLDMIWGGNEIVHPPTVLGIDIDIRPHNRSTIESSKYSKIISLIEGSSIENATVSRVSNKAKNFNNVMVFLDSNHTHEHVLRELEIYSKLVSDNSYIVVFDTIAEDCDEAVVADRPWGKGNSPKSAVNQFLDNNNSFEVDPYYENKALITVASSGFLRRLPK